MPGCRWMLLAVIGLLVLLPMPFGAVYQWSWGLLVTFVALVLAFRMIFVRRSGGDMHAILRGPARWALAGVVLVLFWGAAQTWIPVPGSLAHPAWQLLDEGGLAHLATQGTIAPNAFDAVNAMVRLAGYACVFLLAAMAATSAGGARILLVATTLIVAVYGGYAMLALIWPALNPGAWLGEPPYSGHATGPLVNPNTFASFLAAGLFTGIALIDLPAPATRRAARGPRGCILRLAALRGRQWLLLFGLALIAIALLLTGSRAGAAAAAAGILAMIPLRIAASRGRIVLRDLVSGGTPWIVAGLVFLMLGGGLLLDRLAVAGPDVAGRLDLYEWMLRAIAERPWTGYGLGGFEETYVTATPPPHSIVFAYGHNLYLETVLELGLPAALLLFGLCLFALVSGLRRAWTGDAAEARLAAMAATALAVAVASHGLLDFTLWVPVIAVQFSVLTGALAGAAARSAS